MGSPRAPGCGRSSPTSAGPGPSGREKGGVRGKGGRQLTPLAPADLAQLGRPLVLPGGEEVVGVLQAAQLLVAVGQHLRHGCVRGLCGGGGASSARVPARGGQGQRRWGRGRPAGDGPRAAAAAAPAGGRGAPLGQERVARRCAALRSGSARQGLRLGRRRAALTSSARSLGRGAGAGGRGRSREERGVPASPEGAGPSGARSGSRRAGPACGRRRAGPGG